MNVPADPILLFDGVCNLCNHSVQWVLLRDRNAVFTFASQQSDIGQALLLQHGIGNQQLETVVLIHRGRAYTRSDAALQVLQLLGPPWSVAAVLRWIPRLLRNAVYNWIARNRYRWFGRRESCMLPQPEWKSRFL